MKPAYSYQQLVPYEVTEHPTRSSSKTVTKRCCFLSIVVFSVFVSFYVFLLANVNTEGITEELATYTGDGNTVVPEDTCPDLLSAAGQGFSLKWPWQSYKSNPVTVVTAYYQIPSKKSHCQYLRWMENFLRNIPCHLYIFTSREEYGILNSMRSNHKERTKIIIKEFTELEEYAKMEHWKHVKTMDPEVYHTPELYAIWNQKWRFVENAMKDNVFQSDYFVWCDIGSFRSPGFVFNLTKFPDPEVLQRKVPDKKQILITVIEPFTSEDFVCPNGSLSNRLRAGVINHVAAGLVAGHKTAWEFFIQHYYEMQNYFFEGNLNSGKDQNVVNAVVLKYPDHFQLLTPKTYFNGSGDPWFYFQYYLSQL